MTDARAQRTLAVSSADLGLAAAVVGTLMVMVLPIPPQLLDLGLVASIALSLTILVVSLYLREPLDFSAFPSVLLFATLSRLALNVASTRLILLRGEQGPAAAGRVIETFGQFVVGGNYAVGLIVFVILVVVNFVVITKGATRIAEVAARFTLDAMPGKQMAIDADLNAGLLNEAEARRRRYRIQKEGDFYGAMDGASKFVRGDAVAGLVILAVNLLGGFFIGVIQKGLSAADAARTFSLLSVGDGLATQIPALLVSTAAALVVTRMASGAELGREFKTQLFCHPRALAVVAGMLATFALLPGFPALPFLLAAAAAGGISYRAGQGEGAEPGAAGEAPAAEAAKAQRAEEPPRPTLLDFLELEIGYELIPLVGGEKGGLVERIRALRRQFVADKGFLVPQIHIRDNLRLASKEYVIIVKGIEAGKGELRVGRLLAMSAGQENGELKGEHAREPAFGLPALWISTADKDRAEMMGYTVVDPETVLVTHLSEVIKRYGPELLTRQDVQKLLDGLSQDHPKVVEELIPHHLTVGAVQKVLQNLLREEVPIRDLLTIVETLADSAPNTKDADLLTEYVRHALARTITSGHRTAEGIIPVMTLEPEIEKTLRDGTREGMALDPEAAQGLVRAVQQAVETFATRGLVPIILASGPVRRHLKQLMSHYLPQVVVLSHNEIADGAKIQSLGVVRRKDAA